MILNPKEVPVAEFHHFLLSSIAPRPIALVSSIDENGIVNLSPFSFFNCFSANPPILVFSPSRRVKDNTIKHTLENVHQIKEAVINVVNFSMVEQSSLASTEYEKGVNEFLKAGFTEVPSIKVKPPRVKESPVSFECKVLEIIELGNNKGAGNLVVCEVVLAHCSEEIVDEHNKIDPNKIDLVARMGYNYYCRASQHSLFEIVKPLHIIGIGVDLLPLHARLSKVLTGNDLARLGGLDKIPDESSIDKVKSIPEVQELLNNTSESRLLNFHHLAKIWIEDGYVHDAFALLLLY